MLLPLSLLITASGPSPTAQEIVAQCAAKYDAAKTFQAEVTMTGISPGNSKMFLLLKTVQAQGEHPSMTFGQVKSVKPEGSVTTLFYNDGKKAYTVRPSAKLYSDLEMPENIPNPVSDIFSEIKEIAMGELKVSTQLVGGKAIYVLSAKKDTADLEIRIEKASKSFVSLRTAERQEGIATATDIIFAKQILNAQIPVSVFRWSPPAGYKKVPAGELMP